MAEVDTVADLNSTPRRRPWRLQRLDTPGRDDTLEKIVDTDQPQAVIVSTDDDTKEESEMTTYGTDASEADDAKLEYSAEVDSNDSVKAQMSEFLNVNMDSSVDSKMDGSVDGTLDGSANAKLNDPFDAESTVDEEVQHPVGVDSDDPVDAEVHEPVDTELNDSVDVELNDPVDAEVHEPVNVELNDPVDVEVHDPVDAELNDPVDGLDADSNDSVDVESRDFVDPIPTGDVGQTQTLEVVENKEVEIETISVNQFVTSGPREGSLKTFDQDGLPQTVKEERQSDANDADSFKWKIMLSSAVQLIAGAVFCIWAIANSEAEDKVDAGAYTHLLVVVAGGLGAYSTYIRTYESALFYLLSSIVGGGITCWAWTLGTTSNHEVDFKRFCAVWFCFWCFHLIFATVWGILWVQILKRPQKKY